MLEEDHVGIVPGGALSGAVNHRNSNVGRRRGWTDYTQMTTAQRKNLQVYHKEVKFEI